MNLCIKKRKEVILYLSSNFESELTISEAEQTRNLLTKMIRNAKAYQNYINASSNKAGSEVIINNKNKTNKKVLKE